MSGGFLLQKNPDGSIEYRKKHGAVWFVGVVRRDEIGTLYARRIRESVERGVSYEETTGADEEVP